LTGHERLDRLPQVFGWANIQTVSLPSHFIAEVSTERQQFAIHLFCFKGGFLAWLNQ
jgi:hypothetical protein